MIIINGVPDPNAMVELDIEGNRYGGVESIDYGTYTLPGKTSTSLSGRVYRTSGRTRIKDTVFSMEATAFHSFWKALGSAAYKGGVGDVKFEIILYLSSGTEKIQNCYVKQRLDQHHTYICTGYVA